MKKILVTSALPYVNNIPHLGNMVCVISADFYSRYLELLRADKLFILGTDEHGTTAEQKAKQEGLTPKQLVDKYFKIHTQCYDWFNIKPDCYGRASDKENHKTTTEIFTDLDNNDYILEQETEEAYDVKEKKFLADRFVEGICPHCKYEEARGDQCDNCQKLLTPEELKKPRSKLSDSKVEFKKTKHLYLDLPQLEPEIKEWANAVKDTWSENAKTTTLAFLKEGLKPRAITRDLQWGIKVPKKGYEKKVFYSWFDAPIAYIGITRKTSKRWEQFWKDSNTELVQFMGKDNTLFHTVLFPGYLIGTRKEWSLVKKLSVNEYMNYEAGKFSKSRNVGLFCDEVQNTGISSDAYRYYMMINRPETSDTVFDWDEFAEKINKDLVGNYGNLVNRTLTFTSKHLSGKSAKSNTELNLKDELTQVQKQIELLNIKSAIKLISAASNKANKYFQEQAPWQITNKKELNRVMNNLLNAIKDLSIIYWPLIPESSQKLWKMLGIKKPSWNDIGKTMDYNIGKPELLFNKLEEDKKNHLRKTYGEEEPYNNFDFRIAKILSVKKHPNADKLYVLKVDVGNEKQLVAGLKQHYKINELQGKKIVIINNLEPARLRGQKSEGMLLAAENKDTVKLLQPEGQPGDIITIQGALHNPKKQVSIKDFMNLGLRVEAGKAKYKGKTLVANKKPVTCEVAQGKIR